MIYTQTSSSGVVYRRDPDDPKVPWISDANIKVQHPDVERELNYKMAQASYELGLANLPTPRDPYTIPSNEKSDQMQMPLNWKRNEGGG